MPDGRWLAGKDGSVPKNLNQGTVFCSAGGRLFPSWPPRLMARGINNQKRSGVCNATPDCTMCRGLSTCLFFFVRFFWLSLHDNHRSFLDKLLAKHALPHQNDTDFRIE